MNACDEIAKPKHPDYCFSFYENRWKIEVY